MKLPGGMNMEEMLKQAQAMQEQLQRNLETTTVEAASGGGIVSVRMNGLKRLLAVRIDPQALKDSDVEMLQDLILAAVNEASRKADETMQQKLGGMLPPGLNLPGLT